MYVFDLRTGEKKFLARVSSNAMYVDRGLLLFARDRTLMAQPFDLETLQLGGEPTPVVQNVQFHPSGFAMFAVSASGVLCNRSGFPQLFLKNVDGAEEERPITSTQLGRFPLSWSSDGRFIAYKEIAPVTQMDIDIFDVKERTERRFLASEFNETDASFSPSG